MNNGPNKQNYHHTLRADSQVFSMFKLKMHIKEVVDSHLLSALNCQQFVFITACWHPWNG